MREVLADVAFVAEQFAEQVPGQVWHRRGVTDVAGRQGERDDLTLMIEHQMQLEAEEPARAGLAAPGQAGNHPLAVDPPRVTHRQWWAVDIVEARPSPHPREQEDP